ncbi:hypothetical protein SALSENF001_16400 [Salmonella enterica subsp. enterica serovar Senftenberg]|nr:hypothetical protein SL180013_17330 [Salmonella enterica subsp. enterica serovar Senftenberg]
MQDKKGKCSGIIFWHKAYSGKCFDGKQGIQSRVEKKDEKSGDGQRVPRVSPCGGAGFRNLALRDKK